MPMGFVFVEDITPGGALACAPATFHASDVVERVNAMYPMSDGRRWETSRKQEIGDGPPNPCHCPKMEFRRHWRMTR